MPSLLDHMFPRRRQGTIQYSASLVCRQWHRVAQPFIKRTIRISIVLLNQKLLSKEQKQNAFWKSHHHDQQQKLQQSLSQGLQLIPHTLIYEAGLFPRSDEKELPPEYEKKAWSILSNALIPLVYSSNNPINGLDGNFNGFRIRQLILNVEHNAAVWSRLMPLLEMLGPNGLVSLQLENICFASTIPVERIMEYCTYLQNIRVASSAPPTKDLVSRLKEPYESDTVPYTFASLKSFNPLHIFSSLTTTATINTNTNTDMTESIETIPPSAKRWHLQSVSLHVFEAPNSRYDERDDAEEVAPISLFPQVEHWGISTLGMLWARQAPAHVLLARHRIENRLTSVEISLSYSHGYSVNEGNVGALVHQFLCQSPQLLHFKASDVWIPLELLFVTKALSMKINHGHPRRYNYQNNRGNHNNENIWACRELRTLHFRTEESYDAGIRDYFDEQARVVFGYISRVCPRLEDLSFYSKNMIYRPPVSLCLLSRLQYLRTLQLMCIHQLDEEDIDWIKHYYYYKTQSSGEGAEEGRAVSIDPDFQEFEQHQRQQQESKTLPISTSKVSLDSGNNANSSGESSSNKSGSTNGVCIAEQMFIKTLSLGVAQVNSSQDHDVIHKEPKMGAEAEIEMIGGVDMTHLGQVQDLINYFNDRRCNRDECLWSYLETLSIRFTAPSHHRNKDKQRRSGNDTNVDDNNTPSQRGRQLRDVIKKFRPELSVSCNPVLGYVL
ncbi:hypothetical protein BCR41DRAFT_419948 [Lobosporangium transversale]|uniref:Uncharacterized protein n=1 Tax=Lobosporangium transversale TaxID=64571 RepID=A0A1Y2GXD1_9FUNG|nr:hypothetical protein BCR41DRAFT_419948 [Lobosporangium transversale]ORZ26431.1 hypothetical protein BCR41DRAFT_419948 [Lobosporangium transversale]|eukprot:XP_021884196.1 hypothetical protein BCR41DRAFT_419948 [Lobosporangium transversale]